MTIVVEILGENAEPVIYKVFDFFEYVDSKFSTYKKESEISKINSGILPHSQASADMLEIFRLAEETRKETRGYFNIVTPSGHIDPSGIVKGWAIKKAADIIRKDGFKNFYVNAGGDVEAGGLNSEGKYWTVGIKNPFKPEEVVKIVHLSDAGLATSGTYERGDHIYNPHTKTPASHEVRSITIIGKNVYEADRFATAAFAMGKGGMDFVENRDGLEGYMIDDNQTATLSSNFEFYTAQK